MTRGRIAVKVENGMFDSERSISFAGIGQTYNLIVDENDVADGKLEVQVLEEAQDTVPVALPRDTFTSGSTARVARPSIEVL